MWAEDYFVLSGCARLTDKRTDRQTYFDSNSVIWQS